MGFEIVEPGHMNLVEPLREGEVAIARSGKLAIRKPDLAVAQIGERVMVLADRELFRIALRAARDDSERARSAVVSIVRSKSKKDTGRRTINLSRAIRRLDMEAAAVAGRYELGRHGTGRDLLLIVNLMPDAVSGKAKSSK